MVQVHRNKHSKSRWNILVMRPQGLVTSLSVSPIFLLILLLFSLAFAAVSIIVIHRYFDLVWAHGELAAAHQEAVDELARLRNLYTYQSTVASQYAHLLNAGEPEADEAAEIPADSSAPPEPAAEPAAGTAPSDDASGGAFSPGNEAPEAEAGPLDAWAALFPDPAPRASLNVEKFEVKGRAFRFHLTNEVLGTQAQGHLLILFTVEADGRTILIPYPEFNFRVREVDFTPGPTYNIRSSKPVSGQLDMPPGGRILEMMVLAQSQEGLVVMKKKITPQP